MKFTIGYNLPDKDLDNDTLLMGETGIVHQLDIPCPKLPEGFKAEKIVHVICKSRDDMQALISIVEINSIEQLLDLSRKLGRDLTLERQPQEMFDTVGASLPEFCIVVHSS